jgi:hypothetical protein
VTAVLPERPVLVDRPGVYDMDEVTYFSDPVPVGSLSASGAKLLLPPSCPALFRHAADNPPKAKREFDIGHAAHKYVLGVGTELVSVEANDWRTTKAKEAAKAARAEGKIPLLAREVAQVKAMAAALRRNPYAAALLNPERGKPEQSIFWFDETFGIWRRARLDWLPDVGRGRFIVPDYKGLALDTPIPTPAGWTNMGALQVGDEVFSSSGEPCRVVHKSEVHLRRCFRITFDDRSTVICDDEHLWLTSAGQTAGRPPKVRSTREIKATLRLYGQSQHRVATAGPLALPEAGLPIDPYVFGCWLGDGTAAEGTITKPDDELFELITERGYQCSEPHSNGDRRPMTRTVYGLRKQLRLAGLLGHKEVPGAYLRASRDQRLALLRGLMDTDGSWNSTRGQAVFTTTDKGLALAVRELACSLGQRAIMHHTTQRGFGVTVQAYPVTFTPNGINPFSLSRKADLVPDPSAPPRRGDRSRRRVIVGVDEVPAVPTQCIAVDSTDHTYLCTEQMIPTHNTSTSANPEDFRKAVHNFRYHVQDAWYRAAVEGAGIADDPLFVFIVQMKDPPYLVTIVQLDADAQRVGRDLAGQAMDAFRSCNETGVWPGFADNDIPEIGLPKWAVRDHDSRGEW